jgi:hypothetical protein
MNRPGSARTVTAIGVVAATLGWAAAAWACFPLALVTIAPQASGAAGDEVNVNGVDLGAGAIEVRWNALDGTLLGRGSGPNFSIPVTIPDAPDGVYVIVALTRETNGSVGVKAAAEFQIGSAAAGGTPVSSPPGTQEPDSTGGSSDPQAVLSTTGIAALVLGCLVAGGIGGALVSRRRATERTPSPTPVRPE